MGTDCRINLPDNVSVGNVAKVVARLGGCAVTKEVLGGASDGAWAAQVKGVKVQSTAVPEMVYITFPRNDEHRLVTYHFEFDEGGRLLMPRSTPFWIALGKRLVDFFGGRMDYNDCDDTPWDYEVADKGREANSPQDDAPWDDFQQRVLDLDPLTEAEIDACVDLAAYPLRR